MFESETLIKLGDYSESSVREIIVKILSQLLNERKAIVPNDSIWTDGEFDSIQTEFESKSNKLEIGIWASSKREATVCLQILRAIIDGYITIYCIIEDLVDDKEGQFSLMEVVNELSTLDNYVDNHPNPEKITTELMTYENGKVTNYTIKTCSERMDLWSLGKLISYFSRGT